MQEVKVSIGFCVLVLLLPTFVSDMRCVRSMKQ